MRTNAWASRMDIGTKAKILRLATEQLESVGITYDTVSDPSEAAPRLEALNKHESIHPLSLASNDFMQPKVLWLFFQDNEGRDIGVGAAKLEELGPDDIMTFWARSAKRLYPGETYAVEPVGLSGDLIHLGDLYIVPEWREPRGHTRAAMFCMFTLASLQWPRAQAFYGFVRERYMMRGSAYQYGFTHQLPVPNAWVNTIEEPLSLVSLSLGEFHRQARTFLEYPSTFNSYKTVFTQTSRTSELPDDPPMFLAQAALRSVP